MPSDRQDTNKRYIKIDDFTLGIHSTYWSAGSERTTFKKNGAATIENTYRCVANPDGVLGPLPAIAESKTETQPWAGTGILSGSYVRQTDLLVNGPVIPGVTIGVGVRDTINSLTSVELVYLGWSYILSPGATGVALSYAQVRRYSSTAPRGFVAVARTLPTQDIFLVKMTVGFSAVSKPGITFSEIRSDFSTAANPPPPTINTQNTPKIGISLGGASTFISGVGLRTVGVLSAADQVAFADYYAKTRTQYSNSSDAGPPGIDVFGNLWIYPGYTGDSANYPRSAPRPLNQTTGTANGYDYTSWLCFVAHQARFVGFHIPSGTGGDINNLVGQALGKPLDTFLTYTPFPDYPVQNASQRFLIAANENTSGFGTIGSINASQLLCVKFGGGGVVINGDLDNPTVSQLPHLEPTLGAISMGINTPLGFVYGSRNGIFVWAGGETSDKLSKQIDGQFWDTWTDEQPLGDNDPDYNNISGIQARFTYWHPYVVISNNYLFDTRSGSWWRLDQPAITGRLPYAYNDVSPLTNRLYCAPWAMQIGLGGSHVAWNRYDHDVFASDYSWQSQPLLETELVLDEYDELVLIAQRQNTTGVATVTITLTGYNEDGSSITPAVTVFTLAANTQIQMIRQAISLGGSGLPFVGKGLQYKIVVANTASAAAPLVHDVWLGLTSQHGEHPIVSS